MCLACTNVNIHKNWPAMGNLDNHNHYLRAATAIKHLSIMHGFFLITIVKKNLLAVRLIYYIPPLSHNKHFFLCLYNFAGSFSRVSQRSQKKYKPVQHRSSLLGFSQEFLLLFYNLDQLSFLLHINQPWKPIDCCVNSDICDCWARIWSHFPVQKVTLFISPAFNWIHPINLSTLQVDN